MGTLGVHQNIPASNTRSILELLGSRVRTRTTGFHHSSVLFCTIRQHSSVPFVSHLSAPFVSSVLHHSLATILCHLFMLLYKSPSTNNLATDAIILCRLFNCISEILVIATAAYRTFHPTCRHIYSTVKIQLHYNSFK